MRLIFHKMGRLYSVGSAVTNVNLNTNLTHNLTVVAKLYIPTYVQLFYANYNEYFIYIRIKHILYTLINNKIL